MNPAIFIPARVLGHLVGGLFIFLVAYRISLKTDVSLRQQFSLQAPPIPKWQVLILGISSLAVAYLSGKVARAMFGAPEVEQQAQSFFEQLSLLTTIFHVLVGVGLLVLSEFVKNGIVLKEDVDLTI